MKMNRCPIGQRLEGHRHCWGNEEILFSRENRTREGFLHNVRLEEKFGLEHTDLGKHTGTPDRERNPNKSRKVEKGL